MYYTFYLYNLPFNDILKILKINAIVRIYIIPNTNIMSPSIKLIYVPNSIRITEYSGVFTEKH